MEYLDFYDIAEYGSENWRGFFSPREIAEHAYIYKAEYDSQGLNSHIIRGLVSMLKEDLNDTTSEWIEQLQKGR